MLDAIDKQILAMLERDSRQSLREIAALVGLSAPSVGERIRKLEDRGVIGSFTITIDPMAIGRPLMAMIRLTPRAGHMWPVEQALADDPAVIRWYKVTGENCFYAEVAVADMAALDALTSRYSALATTNSALVKKASTRQLFGDVAADG